MDAITRNIRLFLRFIFIGVFIICLIWSCSKYDDSQLTENEKVIRFTVLVDISNPNSQDTVVRLEKDIGVLILPKTYRKKGPPVKLIIYCHSGGGTESAYGGEAENNEFTTFLASSGFAVMDMAGMPETFSQRLIIDHNRTVGSYVAVRSYCQGYNYVINNYNLDSTGCFLFSNSNGGLVSSNLVNLTDLPIIAQAGIAPLISTELNAWYIYSSSSSNGGFERYQNRANIIRIFGMQEISTVEDLDNAVYEKEKVGIYDPYEYILKSRNPYKVPYKIFHAEDDRLVSFKISEKFAEQSNKRGGNIILRPFEKGGHVGETDTTVINKYIFLGKTLNVTPTLLEVKEWFELFLE